MDTRELKTVALRAAVDGSARDPNIMETAQRYYEWLSAPEELTGLPIEDVLKSAEVAETPLVKTLKRGGSK